VKEIGHFVLLVLRRCGGDTLKVIDELGLSFTQVKALQVLHASDSTSVKALGDELGLSLPAISRAVDGLVRGGYVTRTEDEDDRRMKRVAATAAGRRIVDRLFEIRAAELRRLLETVPERDLQRLRGALGPIMARLAG
jgi:DNA-binding MarR family transcriptional regulator